jgi:predicted GNAT family N-acyltransferase
MTRQSPGARINIVLALGNSRIGETPLGRFTSMTAAMAGGIIPEALRCFVRVVDRFRLIDFDEFAEPAGSEGLVIISADLVTPDGEVKPSPVVRHLREHAGRAALPLALVGLLSESRLPPETVPTGLDDLVADGEGVAERISDAVRRLAPRIWLMLPPPKKPPTPESAEAASEIVIDFPHTIEDFRTVLNLRYAIYRTLGYLPPSMLQARSELDLDAFDPNAIHLLARNVTNGEIVGCARLIVPDGMFSSNQRQTMMYPEFVNGWCTALAEGEDSRIYRDILRKGAGANPLPAASMDAYDVLRDALDVSHPGLRAEDCCELSRLIVSPKVRGQGLSRRLTEAAVRIATAWVPRTIMIVECREHHRRLYEHFGFQATKDAAAETAGLLNAHVIAMWCDLKNAGSRLPHKPNAQVVTSSLTRLFQRSDDPVLRLRGTIPAEAWIWSRNPEPTDKSAQAAFDVSLHNHGLAMATVQALTDLLTRAGGKGISIQSENGDSVEVTATGPDALPQVLKLLSTV